MEIFDNIINVFTWIGNVITWVFAAFKSVFDWMHPVVDAVQTFYTFLPLWITVPLSAVVIIEIVLFCLHLGGDK